MDRRILPLYGSSDQSLLDNPNRLSREIAPPKSFSVIEKSGRFGGFLVIMPKVHDLTVFASTDDHNFSEN